MKVGDLSYKSRNKIYGLLCVIAEGGLGLFMSIISENKTLSDFDGNRQNNFTLIRLIFAWLVLFGHSFAIQPTHGLKNPVNAIFKGSEWIGSFAVHGFFVISGFLVCASLLNRGCKDYVISRFLRVVPGLALCVLLSVFALGTVLTSLSLGDYFSNPKTWEYVKNAFAFFPMEWNLPGVFEDNRREAINGSLWTLNVEVYCYFLLAFIGFFGLLGRKAIANPTIAAVLAFSYFHFGDVPLLGGNAKWGRPGLFFLVGVFFYINRDKVPVNGKLAVFSLVMLAYSFGKDWYLYVAPPFFAYLIFYFAYVIKHIDLDAKLGDISYGVYIYAWPVQQIVAISFPQLNPYGHTVLATAIVFGIAYLSWHYVEKNALKLKPKLMSMTNGLPFIRNRAVSQA
ncbi:acyltransferase family protein [Microbulbifer mangrovi]|uniref:acyltransferase family protein n=1 Tax=Microbulbifer mangrovi TaxID=927787 RepID=UPI0009906EC3|nr:acyltransferase [Microbulbifer mangrovi]